MLISLIESLRDGADTTDYAAGATRYAAFHVTPSAYKCFIRVLRQVTVTGAT